MNRIILISLLILLFTPPVFAQVDTAWVRTYSGIKANALAIDEAGNVYVTGGYIDYVTIKYYPNGDTAWVRTYNGSGNGNDMASDIAVDVSGNVYVTGLSRGSIGGPNYVTIRYNANGDKVWESTYNGGAYDSATAIAIDAYYVYITGESYNSATSFDYATVKYDKGYGSEQWVKRYDLDSLADIAYAIAVDGSGNSYVTGKASDSDTSSDIITIKYAFNGSTTWIKPYNPSPDPNLEEGRVIVVTNSGDNVYVAGSGYYTGTFWDYITISYPATGPQFEWFNKYNAGGYDNVYALAVDTAGNVYVTGTSTGEYGTFKYNQYGDSMWIKRYATSQSGGGEAYGIALDTYGNVYVTGKSEALLTSGDYATIKYTPNGAESWIRRHDVSYDDVAKDIAVDGSSNVYVTGYSVGYGGITIKYVSSSIQCGDANGDSQVTVSDMVYLVSYLFKGGPPPNPLWKADVNCDHSVNVTDITYLQSYLFQGGHVPACCG